MKRPLVFALSLVPALASAEERSFAVTIDGKPAGKVVHSFKAEADGSTAVLCDAQIDEPSGYPFVYRGTEVWKDGRLARLDGAGAEQGRKGGVTLRPGTDGHHLKTWTKDVTVRGEVWPNSFAVMPDPDRAVHVVNVPARCCGPRWRG
jgi:hypothetical protein